MSNEFPDHLVSLLKTSKYLHLATASKDLIPSCSIMHYLYVNQSKTYTKEGHDLIILATPEDSSKFQNMLENPNVALLIHDWVTAKKISLAKNSTSEVNLIDKESEQHQKLQQSGQNNRLLNLLQEMNQAELSQMSATLNGQVSIVDCAKSPEEYGYYKDLLLKDDPDAHAYVDNENERVAIIKVKVNSVKISDNENNTKTI
ncbi:hypothetical protein ACO0RG_000024 [Hanseniaspora osmophila]